MKIIDRYLIKGFIWPFLYCLFLFIFLYVIVDLFANLGNIVKQSVRFPIVLNYYLSSLPLIYVQTVPFAVLLATVFLLGNLNRNNELIALRSSGINSLRIIAPILIVAVAISLSVYFVNDRMVPEATTTSENIRSIQFDKVKREKIQRLENVTVFGRDGRLFFARFYDVPNKTLSDVVLLEHDKNQTLKRKITAESMEWLGDKWRFRNVIILRFKKDGAMIGKSEVVASKIIKFEETPEKLLKNQTQAEFMSYSQLKEYIKILSSESKSTARKLLVDLNYKLSLPLASIVVMLIGIPFALKRTRAGTMLSMGLSAVIAVVFYGLNAIFLALGKGGLLPAALSAWAANIIFAALGIYLINKIRA